MGNAEYVAGQAWPANGEGTVILAPSGGILTVVPLSGFGGGGATQPADNTPFVDGTTPVTPAGFIFDEAAGTALTENDVAAARIDSKRAQAFVIEDETTRGRRVTVTANKELIISGLATAGGFAKAAQLVSTTTDTLIGLGIVRDDVLSPQAADGQWMQARGDNNGATWVHLVDGIVPGTAATNLGKARGGSPTNTDTFVLLGGIRDDALSVLAPEVDGQFTVARFNQNGALWVDAGAGPAQYQEEAVHANQDYGSLGLLVRKDIAAATATADGRYAAQVNDSLGRTYVNPMLYVELTAAPTLDTVAYASGDALHTADITFTGAARIAGLGGVIERMTVIDRDGQGAAGELWLFSATLAATTHTLNTAWNLADADATNCIGVIAFGPYFLGGTAGALNQISVNAAIRLAFKTNASANLFGVLVTRGTPTYTAGGLTVALQISQA